MHPLIDSEVINLVENVAQRRLARRNNRRPATQQQVAAAVRGILARAAARGAGGARPPFSLSTMIRGLAANKRVPIVPATAEADLAYVRALTTGVPGAYLVPEVTAQEIIDQLAQYETFRAAGARVWPLEGVQKITIPVGVSGPSFEWVPENSRQAASDPNFGAISFDLKNLQSLELVPVALFKSTRPEFDVLLADVYAEALAEAADGAMHASSTLSNAPAALMSVSGTTKINCAGSANGGNLTYETDLLSVLQKAADLKLRGPFAWFMNGRSWLRVLSLEGTTSNPLVVPGVAAPPAVGYLLGYPVYLTASIASDEALGSGSNQSHIVFCPPRAVHIGENAQIAVALSDHFALDANQIAVRINRSTDWDFQPAAALVVLQGVN